jgi:uncharacterized protein YkwD
MGPVNARLFLFGALLSLLAGCGKGAPGPLLPAEPAATLPAPPSPPAIPEAEASLAPETSSALTSALALANEIRRQHGLPELAPDPRLSAVAQAHAEDMRTRHFFEHDTPEGVTPFQRMEKAGVRFQAAAENIAMGVDDPREAFDLWLKSPGHRRNLLNKTYRHQGIGFAGGYWVHDFTD